jgi:amino acid adenylation domain-containing protein
MDSRRDETPADPGTQPRPGGEASSPAGWTYQEHRLARIWEEVLQRQPVDRLDDFFALNGSSIAVIEMVARVRDTTGVDLTFEDVFRAPVLCDLSAAIENAQRATSGRTYASIDRSPPLEEYPLSSAQARLWFLEQLYPGIPAYRTITGISFRGALRVPELQTALGKVVARHGSLRASFRTRDGLPVQVILPPAPIMLPVVDLRGILPSEREGEARRLAREDVRCPLDLERDPMLRARLLRLDEDEHVLLLTIHHIVFDAWSRNILLRELSAFYRDACGDAGGADLPAPLPLEYVDYAVWQQSALHRGELENDRAYWKEHLGHDPTTLELTPDHPRPAIPDFEGLRESLVIPADLGAQLVGLAAGARTTTATLILAAFQSLLHRHAESDSVVLGLVVAGRNHPGTEPLIGLFVNELALRVDVGPDDTFIGLLAKSRRAMLGGLAHQDLPLDEQIRTARPARQIDQSPLFRIAYNYKPRRQAETNFGDGLRGSELQLDPGVAPFDLMLSVERAGDESILHFDFSRTLFGPTTVRRMADQLRVLLEGVVAGPGQPVGQLQLLGPEERQEVLRASSGPWPEDAAPDVVERIRSQAARRPDHVAVEAPDDRLSYGQLESTTNRLARRLRSLGVGRESRVGVAVPRGARELCALLATLKAGGAYVPVDAGHPVERVRLILEDAAPEVLIAPSDSPLRDAMPPGTRLLPLDDLAAATAGFEDTPLDEPVDPGQLVYILFTSGSTGRPKGVEVLRGGFANFLRSMAREPGLQEDDRFLAITTTTFDISGLELFGPLWVGATTVIVDRQTSMDPRLLGDLLASGRFTILQATPATWRMLVDAGWKGTRGLRMLCGGEALSRDLANRLLERGSELWNLYGPTETTIWSTLDRVSPGDERITIGRPLDRTRVYVLDPALGLVPPGVVGEIYIGGDGVARGYRGRPDLTAERFLPDLFGPPGSRLYRTGDLGRLLEDGRFECLGRTDHQVKVRGFRIELGEIEAALRAVPGVREVVVAAEKRGTADPRLVAYWVGDAEREALYDRARSALAPYMVPSAYARLEAFPLTTSGKIDRKALPSPDDVTPDATPALVQRPRDDTEARIAALLADVLGIDSVGIDQDFFALGGTSLLAILARARLEQEFGLEVPLRAFFDSPTVASIASRVGSSVDPDEPIIAWLGRKPADRPPLFCLLGVQLYQDIADALGGVQPVVGIHVPVRYRPGEGASIRIEAIAENYISHIRTIQAHGPYHLAGFCFGGIVAYEVARQLERAGEEVAQVAIFDGGLSGAFQRRRLAQVREVGSFLLHPSKVLGWYRRRRLARSEVARRLKIGSRTGLVDLDANSPEMRAIGRRYERTLGKINSHVLVFRALNREVGPGALIANDLGWSRFAKQVSVCGIPSAHIDLVQAPQASIIAAEWAAGLRARTGTPRSRDPAVDSTRV